MVAGNANICCVGLFMITATLPNSFMVAVNANICCFGLFGWKHQGFL
jgi:hypothetical protein